VDGCWDNSGLKRLGYSSRMKLTAAGVDVDPRERQPLWATLPDSSSTNSTMEIGPPCR